MTVPALPSPEQFSRFLALCQEKTELPPDIEFSRLSREAFRKQFEKLEHRMRLAEAAQKFYFWASIVNEGESLNPPCRRPGRTALDDFRFEAFREWRRLCGELIRMPAPDRGGVALKKQLLRSRQFEFFGITAAEAQARVDADEAFLASHPLRKPRTAGRPEAAA